MPISKKLREQIIGAFQERGWHNSPSGLTAAIVIEWCEGQKRAYRVDTFPGVCKAIWLLDHQNYRNSPEYATVSMLQLFKTEGVRQWN